MTSYNEMTRPNGMLVVYHGDMGSSYPAHYAEDLDVIRVRVAPGWWTCPYHYFPEQVSRKKMNPVWRMKFQFFGGDENKVLYEGEQPVPLDELIRRLAPVNISKVIGL